MGIDAVGEQIRPERFPESGRDPPRIPACEVDSILRVMETGLELGRNVGECKSVSETPPPPNYSERKSLPYTDFGRIKASTFILSQEVKEL